MLIVRCSGGSGGGGSGWWGYRMGIEVRSEIIKGKGSEVASVEGVGIEMENGLPDGGSCGGNDGFGQAGAHDDKIEVHRVDRRV